MKGLRWTLSFATLAAIAGANATIYTFTPPVADLNDLEHGKAYAWGLKLNIPSNYVITSAKLTIEGIYDWKTDEPNKLMVTLLNTPPPRGTNQSTGGVNNYLITKTDNESKPNYWETSGSWGGWSRMYNWSDSNGPISQNKLVYDFSSLFVYNQSGSSLLSTSPGGGASLSLLNQYVKNDGFFGIGFDPDCHFFNKKVTLKIETGKRTTSVPGPMAVIPFVFGLFAAFRRKRNAA